MKRMSKRVKTYKSEIDSEKAYPLDEAIELLKKFHQVKFDETVEYHANLGVDPKYAEQMVRGTLSLPAGTGKVVKVCVITSGENVKIAEDAGADIVGGDDIIEKIQKENFLEFDIVVASPDMMRNISKVARILGPRGLMPNPKLGTVTKDISKAVTEFKAGKIEYKVDKLGNMHLPLGKISFDNDKIKENFIAAHKEIVKAKPATLKGVYLRSLYLSSTMGPGIKVDPSNVIL
ncbi:50S ribosomal protein L1 [bacterium]|nr:50S ribosomal protein L1 [bacterium]